MTVYGCGEVKGGWSDQTEFYGEYRDNQFHFHIEELIPVRNMEVMWHTAKIGNDTLGYSTRYAHLILDDLNCLHLDIAYREYPNKEIFQKSHHREDWNLQNTNKLKSYTTRYKFLRFDSDISQYQEIIGLAFRMNPYIHEFFGDNSDLLTEIENNRKILLNNQLLRA